jgi:glycosyltransferase involved in cell wall biosynthesis
MNVLYVSDYYKPAYCYGGGVTSTVLYCEGLSKVGVSVTVYTTDANCQSSLDTPIGIPQKKNGVEVIYFKRISKILNFFYSPGLGQHVKQNIGKFDIVIAGSLWGYGNLISIPECRKKNIPYLIPLQGQLNPWAFQSKKWKKWLYFHNLVKQHLKNAAMIICTDASEEAHFKKYRLNQNTVILPFGIVTNNSMEIKPSGLFKKKLHIEDESRILLFSGRIVKIKRPDIALKTLVEVRNKGLDVHLVFVGPDEENLIPGLQSMAAASGCLHRVHFTGLLSPEQMADAYLESDLLLATSDVQENFGLSALEALSFGLPVLATDGIPVGRIATEKGAARIVPCDEGEISRNVVEVLSDSVLYNNMSMNARKLIRDDFDNNKISEDFYNHLLTIIKNKTNEKNGKTIN